MSTTEIHNPQLNFLRFTKHLTQKKPKTIRNNELKSLTDTKNETIALYILIENDDFFWRRRQYFYDVVIFV